jgi:ribosomal protein L37AE/L43A
MLTKNRNKRDCPVCGKGVKRGVVQCDSCGYDFRHGRQTIAPAGT